MPTFSFRKRHQIAVTIALVSASVIGCTRTQGTFWGTDGFTFKDATGKLSGLVGKDKSEGGATVDRNGQVRKVGVIEPGREHVASTKSDRTGSSLLGPEAGKAHVAADNLSNPFIALGREKPGRVVAASSTVPPQQQKRVVTADSPEWAEDAGTSHVANKAESFVPAQAVPQADPFVGTSRVASKADNSVPARAPQEGQFVDTFNSQMDRLRAEMKADAGRARVTRGDQRSGSAPEFPDVPRFDESVAPNESVEVETLKAPEIAHANPFPSQRPELSVEMQPTPAVAENSTVLPVITPRKRGQASAQQAGYSKVHAPSVPAARPVEKTVLEPAMTAPSAPTTVSTRNVPTPSTTWDSSPPQQPVVTAPVVAAPVLSAPVVSSPPEEPTLVTSEPANVETADPADLVVATRSGLSRDEIRRGLIEKKTRNAANVPMAVSVPDGASQESDATTPSDVPVPRRAIVDLPTASLDGRRHAVPERKGGVVTADGSLEAPQPLSTRTMIAEAVPASRVPAFSSRMSQQGPTFPTASLTVSRGASFSSKTSKPAATTALDAVDFDADASVENETKPSGGFPKWPVPVGIAIASVFFVFARRRLRSDD